MWISAFVPISLDCGRRRGDTSSKVCRGDAAGQNLASSLFGFRCLFLADPWYHPGRMKERDRQDFTMLLKSMHGKDFRRDSGCLGKVNHKNMFVDFSCHFPCHESFLGFILITKRYFHRSKFGPRLSQTKLELHICNAKIRHSRSFLPWVFSIRASPRKLLSPEETGLCFLVFTQSIARVLEF